MHPRARHVHQSFSHHALSDLAEQLFPLLMLLLSLALGWCLLCSAVSPNTIIACMRSSKLAPVVILGHLLIQGVQYCHSVLPQAIAYTVF